MFLQFYSQTIREGESHQAIFNGSEAARGIVDVQIGSVFMLPQYFNQTINMLSMTNEGCYLYVILPLSSRMGDYLSLVLFIPRQILISAAADIPTIREAMETVLLENRDAESLRQFFEWDYPTLDIKIEGKAEFNKYACLWLENDGDSIQKFLGKPILYSEFLRYTGVFLLPPSYKEITNGNSLPTLYAASLSAPQLHLQANDKHGIPHKDSIKSSAQDKKIKSPEKDKKSLRWLWGLLSGIILGAAIGFATFKWLLPQEQPKPATTNTIPNDSIPNDSIPNDSIPGDSIPGKTIPNDTLPSNGSTSGNAIDNATGDGAVAPSAYHHSSGKDDRYNMDYDDYYYNDDME